MGHTDTQRDMGDSLQTGVDSPTTERDDTRHKEKIREFKSGLTVS